MKITEQTKQLREKTVKQLHDLLEKEKVALHKLRFSQSFRNLKDTSKINKSKKYIARIMTILREKISSK